MSVKSYQLYTTKKGQEDIDFLIGGKGGSAKESSTVVKVATQALKMDLKPTREEARQIASSVARGNARKGYCLNGRKV